MKMVLEIPDEQAAELREKLGNVGRAALEALAARAYEQEILGLEQVRLLLGLPSRWEAQDVLSRHGVWPGTTVEDAVSDFETLQRLRPRE